MKKRTAYRFAGVVSLSALLASCSHVESTYVIGVSQPMTGELANAGKVMMGALQMHVDELNAHPPVPGAQFKLALFDDENQPQKARQVAESIVAHPNLIAVIGPFSTPAFLAALEVYDRAKVPVISLIESSPQAAKASRYAYSMNSSYQEQADLMAVYMKAILKLDRVLLLHTTDTFGMESKKFFAAKAGRVGMALQKTISFDPETQLTEEYLRSQLTDEDAKQVGGVVAFMRVKPAMTLLPLIRKVGIKRPIMGSSFFAAPTLLTLPKKVTKDLYFVSPFVAEIANEMATQFLEKFRAKEKREPHMLLPLAYDSLTLIAQGVAKGATTAEKMQKYLSELTSTNSADGITGPLFFNKEDRTTDRDPMVSVVKDGRFKVAFRQLVEPREDSVLATLNEQVAKGKIIVVDSSPYQLVDVVLVGLDYLRVAEVDTRVGKYEADLFLWFKWMGKNVDTNDIRTLNVLKRKDTEKVLIREDLSKPVKYRAYRLKEQYYSPFNLAKFPFDTQTLPIYIGHRNKPSTELVLVWDRRHMEETPVPVTDNEWRLHDRKTISGLIQYKSTFGEPTFRLGAGNRAKVQFSIVRSTIQVKRILLPYLFNLFIPLFIILMISLLILMIPVEQFVLRVNASMTALLSILVYYMAQKSALPKVGYLMKSDYYFILAFGFIMGIKVINVLVVNVLVKHQHKEAATAYNRRFAMVFIPGAVAAYTLATALI
jgi:branched-chain amino acid transport system substrate-binding protein